MERKDLFISVCYCFDPKNCLQEKDTLYPHGGVIGYDDSYLNTVFRFSRVFRLHAMLHDAAGTFYAQNGSGSGYSYVI